MKIHNVYLKQLNMNTSVNHISTGSVPNLNENYEYGKTLYSYKPVNLKGIDTIAFIGDLKSLDGMHCPLCGTKMLSQKEAQQAFKEADNIKSPEEFCNFLEKYSENINTDLKNIIKDSKMQFYKNTNPELQAFLYDLKAVIEKRTINTADKTCETVNEILQDKNISEQDKKLIKESFNDIKQIIDKKNRAALLKNLCITTKNTLSLLQYDKKSEIYEKITQPLKKAARQEMLFEKDFKDTNNSEPLHKTILKNLLHYSKSDIHKVHQQKETQNGSILNLMLSCEYCAAERKNLYKLTSQEEARHYYVHIQELIHAASDGKLESNKTYPIKLSEFVKETSGGRLNPQNKDI